MQPRLTRSSTESMIAGVCGGLGEYFSIDPVIVRAIFVLVTFTSGLGIPVYIILLLLMPRGNPAGSARQPYSQQLPQFGQQMHHDAWYQQASQEVMVPQQQQQASRRQSSVGSPNAVPAPSQYRFDPLTGEPLSPDAPATGQTVNLRVDAPELPSRYAASDAANPGQPAAKPKRNWQTLGIILVGIGGLILLEQVVGSLSFVFPALLIIAGIILLARRR